MIKVYHEVIKVKTTEKFQLIDITRYVEAAVEKSQVKNGIVLVFAPHATAGVVVNENESGLISDILEKIKEFTEPGSLRWRHNLIDNNAHAHIGSALFGSERVLPVINGRLVRGTWQNIFLMEMDGPRREREVVVFVMGD